MTLKQLQAIFPNATDQTWHQHSNGGGWVENTASIDAASYLGPNAQVWGSATVALGTGTIAPRIDNYAQVGQFAVVKGRVIIDHSSQILSYSQVLNQAADTYAYPCNIDNSSVVAGVGVLINGPFQIRGNVQIYDNAQLVSTTGGPALHDGVTVRGQVQIQESCIISGPNNANRGEGPLIAEMATVKGHAYVHGGAHGSPVITDSAIVTDTAQVLNCSVVDGTTVVSGSTVIDTAC